MHRDLDHAPEMARAQRVRSLDLLEAGIGDVIVPELPDAADEPEGFCRRVGDVLRHQLAWLRRQDVSALVVNRARSS